ncbi:FKBP-type peptidyl-prolyl cis-trans isomerase [Motilimonas sp. KMU-193]|uniref:FKBP-type peptidyl-prolyl cis-trans isomerase n=1 Tax=Motilimonas sp. KMU-193 TaxID=3388668 RepID=UPI00396B2440
MSKAITANSEVVMHFTIKLADGSAADSTKVNNKPAKFRMGDGSLTVNFEKCLLGLTEGENKSFELQPQDAFGMPNPDNIYHVERSKFSSDAPAEVGAIIAFTQPDGTELPGIIREVTGESVTVDFNHPLAGQALTFDVEVISID